MQTKTILWLTVGILGDALAPIFIYKYLKTRNLLYIALTIISFIALSLAYINLQEGRGIELLKVSAIMLFMAVTVIFYKDMTPGHLAGIIMGAVALILLL